MDPPIILGVNDAGESFGIEGETVVLSCDNEDNAELNEQFQWFDSEGVALDLSGLVGPHRLILDDVMRNQSGVYVCVVFVGDVSLSVNTTLIVQCKWAPCTIYSSI